MKRNEVNERDTWRTEDIFSSVAEWEKEFNITCCLCIVRKLFVIVEAKMICRNSQIFKILSAVFLEIIVKVTVCALFAEGLEFHLLKFNCSEGKVTGCNFVSERLAYLTDAERKLCSHCTKNIYIVNIFTLCIFRTEIDNALAVVRNTSVGLEHKVKFPDICKIMFTAVRARNAVVLNILEHFLLGHTVCMGIRIEIINKVICSVAHFTFLAVKKRV